MKYFSDYRFITGAITVLSGLLALACLLVGAMAVEYNFDAFSDPVLTLNYVSNYQLAKWFNLLDMFGYYLLLLPLIFYFHQQYKYKSPWTSLFTFSGLAYVFTGALGAAILAAIWPDLMVDYSMASSENKTVIITVFKATTLLVTKGMWNILEVLFAAVWWIGLGKMICNESKSLGILTIITGISTLMDATGNITGIQVLSDIGLNAYLLLGIIWPVIIGISLIKRSFLSQSISLINNRTMLQSNQYENA